MSVTAPQPTMVTHSSVVMRASAASTPTLSILLTSTIMVSPATISRTLKMMEMAAAFFTLTWPGISPVAEILSFIVLTPATAPAS